MKHKRKILLLLIALPIYSFASAQCAKSSSYCIYKNDIIDNINGHHATLILDNMTVTNMVKGSYGGVRIKDSKINHLNTQTGSLSIKNSTFSNTITGGMAAMYVRDSILQDFNASAHKIYLRNGQMGNIKIENRDHDMSIRLYDKSVIYGDVEFVTHHGKICLYDEMSQIKGKVINGEVIKGACEDKWDDWNK